MTKIPLKSILLSLFILHTTFVKPVEIFCCSSEGFSLLWMKKLSSLDGEASYGWLKDIFAISLPLFMQFSLSFDAILVQFCCFSAVFALFCSVGCFSAVFYADLVRFCQLFLLSWWSSDPEFYVVVLMQLLFSLGCCFAAVFAPVLIHLFLLVTVKRRGFPLASIDCSSFDSCGLQTYK